MGCFMGYKNQYQFSCPESNSNVGIACCQKKRVVLRQKVRMGKCVYVYKRPSAEFSISSFLQQHLYLLNQLADVKWLCYKSIETEFAKRGGQIGIPGN